MTDVTYPDSDVLINHYDIKDWDKLLSVEDFIYAVQAGKILPVGNFNIEHLKAIHRHFFSPLYPWAGEFRQVNMSKDA